MEMTNIVNLPIDQLYPHPLNPRKALGDLSELADSIAANGVLQNLTVVRGRYNPSAVVPGAYIFDKEAEGYTIVIGHRRKGGAELAGLKELPCLIVDISESEQVQMMCMENMQRSDLTIYEQAMGFQMMMDYGGTIEEVSEKTGFSKTTIRRRLQLAKLDRETMEAVSSRQASLQDYERLSQIENIETRNKVLCEIGTNNFDKKMADALSAQESAKNIAAWKELFEKHGIAAFASENPSDIWSNKYENLGYFDGAPNETKLLEKLGERDRSKCFYKIDGRYVYLRAIREYTEEQSAELMERERRQEEDRIRRAKINELATTAFKLRFDFVKNFPLGESKKVAGKVVKWIFLREIVSMLAVSMFSGYSAMVESKSRFSELFDVKNGDDRDRLVEFVDTHSEKSLLWIAYSLYSDAPASCTDYSMRFRYDPKLKWLYKFLCDIGYSMSDDEIQMMNGTHPLFVRDENETIDTENDDAETVESEDENDIDALLKDKLDELLGEE